MVELTQLGRATSVIQPFEKEDAIGSRHRCVMELAPREQHRRHTIVKVDVDAPQIRRVVDNDNPIVDERRIFRLIVQCDTGDVLAESYGAHCVGESSREAADKNRRQIGILVAQSCPQRLIVEAVVRVDKQMDAAGRWRLRWVTIIVSDAVGYVELHTVWIESRRVGKGLCDNSIQSDQDKRNEVHG